MHAQFLPLSTSHIICLNQIYSQFKKDLAALYLIAIDAPKFSYEVNKLEWAINDKVNWKCVINNEGYCLWLIGNH
jgi:hypothetical protein